VYARPLQHQFTSSHLTRAAKRRKLSPTTAAPSGQYLPRAGSGVSGASELAPATALHYTTQPTRFYTTQPGARPGRGARRVLSLLPKLPQRTGLDTSPHTSLTTQLKRATKL
jgi:hypothetical protein